MQLFFAILKLSEFNKPSFKGLANERKKKKKLRNPSNKLLRFAKKKIVKFAKIS